MRQADSSSVVIQMGEFERLISKVRAASDADLFPLLDAIGQQQEDAARKRIRDTKQGPDGQRWSPWSPAYSLTRGPQHSLLVGEGNLADSMDHQVDGKTVVVGSNLVYAGRHLHGDEGEGGIPARPYLDTDGGFADPSDRRELRDIVRDFMGGLL